MAVAMNLAAERGVLGSILVRNESIWETGALRAEDFAEKANEELFRLLQDVINSGRAATATLILADHQDAPIWGELKASDYLRRLEDEAPPPSLVAEMARTIRDEALKRRLDTVLSGLLEKVRGAPVSLPGHELREDVEHEIAALFASAEDVGMRHLPAVNDLILRKLGESEEPIGIKLGLASLEGIVGTLQPGRVVVIGAPPGGGKSALLVKLLRNAARQGHPAALFSPEMDAEEVGQRALASDTGVKADRIERNVVNQEEYSALARANDLFRKDQLWIDDTTLPSLQMIEGRATRLKKLHGLSVVGVDHLQYMAAPDRRMGPNDAIDFNLAGLKAMAKKLDIAVIVLAQFATEPLREMSRWPFRKPSKADFLFSGTIDRHADVIVTIYRPEPLMEQNKLVEGDKDYVDYLGKLELWRGRAEFTLGKRRGGLGWGSREVFWDGNRVDFTDSDPRPKLRESDDLLTGIAD